MRLSRMFSSLVVASFLAVSTLSSATFVVDNGHTSVGFSIKHMMITNVTGVFKEFDGKLDFDEEKKSFNSLNANVVVASIDTGIQKRDEHLRSADFFEVNKYPKITFKMTKYTPNGDEGEMEGELTIRDITKKVVLKTEIGGIIKDQQGNKRLGFSLSGKINRKDFGLTWNKTLETGGVVVGDEVKLNIEVQAKESSK